MRKGFTRPALAFTVFAALLLGSVHAQIPEAVDKPAKVKTKKTKKADATGHGPKVKFVPGSQETVNQRSARLARECKGAVNAGVCEGYTR